MTTGPASLAQAMVDAMSVPAWLQQGEHAVHTNGALQRLLGHDNDTLCATPLVHRIGDESQFYFRQALDECLTGSGEPPAQSLDLITHDESTRPVELSLRRVRFDPDSEPVALITCMDLSDMQHVQSSLQAMSRMLRQIVDGAPVASFVIDAEHRITHWNCACEHMTARSADEMIGSTDAWRAFYLEPRTLLANMIVDEVSEEEILRRFGGHARLSSVLAGAYEVEAFFPNLGPDGQWLYFTAAALRDDRGRIIGAIETLQDITERRRAEEELTRHRKHLEQLVEERSVELARRMEELRSRFTELQDTNRKLEEAQNQLLQSDKMASIGQLAAGIAHEINNPVGFVTSNLHSLRQYIDDLMSLVDASGAAASLAPSSAPERLIFDTELQRVELDYLKQDLPQLLDECADGLGRVKRIVQDLKDFSRVDQSEWQEADLNAGIQSTLNVVRHEVKYKAEVVQNLGTLPPVLCLAAQLNQVFMNLIVNAAQAMKERGVITLSSGTEGEWAWVQVDDTGCGMSEEVLRRIFEPFYTTKEVGKGTGLGLSLSFSIVQKHGGTIQVRSTPGAGSSFRVWVPLNGPATQGQPPHALPEGAAPAPAPAVLAATTDAS